MLSSFVPKFAGCQNVVNVIKRQIFYHRLSLFSEKVCNYAEKTNENIALNGFGISL